VQILTEKQAWVMRWIHTHPMASMRDLSQAIGRQLNMAWIHVDALRSKGWLAWAPHKAYRALVVRRFDGDGWVITNSTHCRVCKRQHFCVTALCGRCRKPKGSQ
jgi:hypothetical protein